jgi:hypothetical protein
VLVHPRAWRASPAETLERARCPVASGNPPDGPLTSADSGHVVGVGQQAPQLAAAGSAGIGRYGPRPAQLSGSHRPAQGHVQDPFVQSRKIRS